MSYLTDIERLNYYEGEFLGAVDFQAEQEYHRDMRRRHNLGQHTWGIVTGLDLAQAPNGSMDGSLTVVDVYLQPGMAVDGFGREIVVLNQFQLSASMFAAVVPQGQGNVQNVQTMQIWIGFQQALLQPTSDSCTSMNVSNAYARIQETYTLTVTAQGATPTNSAIVVNGSPTTPPPSTTTIDPPPVTLPNDNSIPYQEFSTDDTGLTWWLALGQVSWDASNGLFVQTATPSAGREYVGNVSAETYAPAGIYRIADRNSPYPPPVPTKPADPNLSGVSAEVAGSLQVDYLLNAEITALIGAPYNTNNPVTRPLTIVDNGDSSLSLIEFRSSKGQTPTWYVSQLGNGNAGLNFGQMVATSGSPPTPKDGILFLNGGNVGAGNVGVGTTSPSQNLSVNAGINLDQAGANTGKLDPGLTFGNTDSAGISSNQTTSGSNPGGLDLYTLKSVRVSITNGGYVGIGTTSPQSALQIETMTVVTEGPGTTGAWANFGSNAYFDGTWKRVDTTKAGVNLHMNAQDGAGQEFRFHLINANGSGPPGGTGNIAVLGSGTSYLLSADGVGIGTSSPEQNLSVNGGMNIDQGNANNGSTGDGIRPGPGLTFGSGSGEGIASCRGGGVNQDGLDFYTDFAVQVSISQQGEVGVDQSNQNAGNSLIPGLVFGTNANGRTATGFGTGEGIASNRTTLGLNVSPGANQYGLDFYTQSQVRMQITNSGDVHIMGHLYANGVQLA
jgi:hypothetical protein